MISYELTYKESMSVMLDLLLGFLKTITGSLGSIFTTGGAFYAGKKIAEKQANVEKLEDVIKTNEKTTAIKEKMDEAMVTTKKDLNSLIKDSNEGNF